MKKSNRIISTVCSAAVFLSCIVSTISSASAEEIILPTETQSVLEERALANNSNGEDLLYNYMLIQSGVNLKSDSMRNGFDISYKSGITAGSKLSGRDKIAYDYLKTEIQAIAAGQRTSTRIEIPFDILGVKEGPWSASELGVSYIYSDKISQDAIDTALAKSSIDFHKVLLALLADCPYELYWCDKTTYNSGASYSYSRAWENGEWQLYLTPTHRLSLYVSTDYSVDGAAKTTELPADRMSAVQAAISNAQSIVNEISQTKSGKDLLAAYRDRICALTTYDYDAPGGQKPYGDPWQLIYVFDGDSSTNVVCEGYAKAFKYLCDLSADKLPGISCMIATGTIAVSSGNVGSHMWNVVNMEDNHSYLVDITQCDAMDAYWEPGPNAPSTFTNTFFMSTPSGGTYNSTYQFSCTRFNFIYQGDSYTFPAQDFYYTYSDDTLDMYDSKYLNLSTISYIAYTYVPAKAATCDTDGNVAYYVDDNGQYYVMDSNGSYIEMNNSDVIVPKSGHDWNPPTYTWNGVESVTARHICKNDASHVETETAPVSSEVITPASYNEKGWTRYTASFSNGSFTSQTKDVQDIPKLVGTEVVIEISDINGIKTRSTVIAETFSLFEFPDIYLDGYNFIGWTINGETYSTAEAANVAVVELVRAGTNVTIEVVFEKIPDKFNVSVENGKLSTGKTSDEIQVSKLVTAKAGTVSGMTFSYWLRNGIKVSTNSTYFFYMPSENVELKAVFAETAVDPVGTAIIESVKATTNKLSFVSVLNVPKNCKFVKGGLVATNNDSVGESVDANNSSYVKLSTKTTVNTKNLKYTWIKYGVGSSTWYVRAYLVYMDSNGVEHTVYSNCVKADKNGIIG